MFPQMRILTGLEMLMLHGMPRGLLEHPQVAAVSTDALMKDLAGNSFLAGAVLLMLITTLLHIPADVLLAQAQEEVEEEVDELADQKPADALELEPAAQDFLHKLLASHGP